MLNCIQMMNFQRHIERTIVLSPTVTVLVGDNGTGKSAVIRALLWAALNIWKGAADKFIHWDAEDAEVVLVFGKNRIERQKGKLGNFYTLNGHDLKAVNRNVPEAIERLVNMTEDNFHEQLDPAFWFSLTAGQVAKSLNKIVNLSDIDASLANIGKELRQARDRASLIGERLTTTKKIKKSLDWTRQADEDLAALEEKQRKATEKRAGVTRLASKIKEMERLTLIRDNAAGVAQSGQKLIEKMESLDELRQQCESLRSHLSQIDDTTRRLKWIQAELAEKEPRLRKAQAGRCPLCKTEPSCPHK